MPFLLLLVLSLVTLQRKWPAPPSLLGANGSVILTWGLVALFSGSAWFASRRLRAGLTADGIRRYAVFRRYAAFRRWHAYVLMAVFATVVCFGGWGWIIGETLGRGELVVPGTDLALMAPLFASLMLSWAAYQPLEKALNQSAYSLSPEPFPGRLAYVGLQARNNFILVAAPMVLMILQQIILNLWPDLVRDELLWPLSVVVMLACMFVLIPWFLRIFLGLRPLPDGPLRDRLMEARRRLSFRCNDILVWNTRHTIVNAMVAGPLPLIRYVILTDRLIVELTPEEIEAVFGHEVGHIKHHHLLFYFVFLLSSLFAAVGLWETVLVGLKHTSWFESVFGVLKDWPEEYEGLSQLPLLGLLGIYVFIVFGFLSRRCERQADIHGSRTVSVPVFVDALEKVADLNGISRDRPGWLMSWQHSTIARRVEFLQRMQADPRVEPRFQRRVGLVKLAILLSLGLILVALAMEG
jgi:Zn-dependent protease with chaperone function